MAGPRPLLMPPLSVSEPVRWYSDELDLRRGPRALGQPEAILPWVNSGVEQARGGVETALLTVPVEPPLIGADAPGTPAEGRIRMEHKTNKIRRRESVERAR